MPRPGKWTDQRSVSVMDAPTDPNERVIVGHYGTRHEAEIAKGLLESAGISCALFADDAGGWYPALLAASPARLVVRAEDQARAREILEGRGPYLSA